MPVAEPSIPSWTGKFNDGVLLSASVGITKEVKRRVGEWESGRRGDGG